jgi:heptosyltransferase II
MRQPRFLIVRVIALGDVALATPLLNRIRAEHPDAHVTWLCGTGSEQLVRLFPGVDEVVVVDEQRLFRGNVVQRAGQIVRAWSKLATHSFDHVLMLHPDPRYRVLTLPVRARRLTAAHHRPSAAANPIPARFRGDENARLLDGPVSRGPIAKRFAMLDLRAKLPAATRRGRLQVALVPGGARNVLAEAALKRWPVASYRRLAEGLIESGCEVILVGGPTDRVYSKEFAGLPVCDTIGTTSLLETLQLLRDANLVVTHDTGPLHLARLVRAPTIAIFGPTDPAQFVGDDENVTVIWGGADLACRPCYDGKHFARCSDNICINRIEVAHVLAAAQKRLAAGVSSRGV